MISTVTITLIVVTIEIINRGVTTHESTNVDGF